MTEKTPLAGALATISLRALLQKALLRYLPIWLEKPLPQEFGVPLSSLQRSLIGEYQYISAIAHPLAAIRATPATILAPSLAQAMTEHFAQPMGPQARETIAAGLQIHATPAGWLVVTLAPAGLAAWLRHWQQSPLPMTVSVMTDSASSPPRMANCPLCDRLQLSLPMVLQWAHARCQTWRLGLEAVPEQGRSPRSAQTFAALPEITQALLPTCIQGVDQIAARGGEMKVCWRQGYRLAEQVYQYDAEWAQGRSPMAEPAAREWSVATLAATQKVLALILMHVWQQSPRCQL